MPTVKRAGRDAGERKLTLVVPDARSKAVRSRVARSSERLSPEAERDAMDWIESVSIMNEQDGDGH